LNEPWRYLAVLKGLEAEYRALAWLSIDNAASVTPLIQLWHKAPKPEGGDAAGDSDDQARGDQVELFGRQRGEAVWRRLSRQLLANVRETWPHGRPLALDGEWLEDAEAFETVLDSCRMSGRPPLPVTGLHRTAEYSEVVDRTIRKDGAGAVLRLGRSDFRNDSADDLRHTVDEWLASRELLPGSVDVVLDLRAIQSPFRERDEYFLKSMLRLLPHVEEWRNLAFAGSGMPENARSFGRDDITPFARSEWWVWLALRQRGRDIPRLPVFGDYGVIHPERVEAIGNPKVTVRIPAVLYTSNDDCLMVRGKDLNRGWTIDDVRHLFRRLIDGPDWCDRGYSKGDEWISDVVSGKTETAGGWMSWRRAGSCHHWTYVSRQLASLLDS
jgi:hypothetical protein